MRDLIIDPPRGSVKSVPHVRGSVRDRDMRRELISCKNDVVKRRKHYVYDRKGNPLGIVIFEPCNFDPRTGRRRAD